MKYPDLLQPFQVSVWDFTVFERISQCNFPCFNLMRRKKKFPSQLEARPLLRTCSSGMTCLVIKSTSALPSQHFLYNGIAVKCNKLFYINKSSHPILWEKETHLFMQEEILQLSSTQAACVLEPLLPGINNNSCALQLRGWLLQTLNIGYIMLQSMYSPRPIDTHFGKTRRTCMSYVKCLSSYYYTSASCANCVVGNICSKTVHRETNTALFRVILLSQELWTIIRDILMVVWVNSPIICPPAHFPLLNVKGPFTNSIHLFACTFPSAERQGAVHRLDTSVHLHISLCWTSRGRSQTR